MLALIKIMKVLALVVLIGSIASLLFSQDLTADETTSRIVVSVSLLLNYISLSISEENERHNLNNQ